jgi:spectrin alpha
LFLYSVLKDKLKTLGSIAKRRKGRLPDNSAYLQFMWKTDVVESWIADKENHVRSEDFGRELSSVQTLLTKQETLHAGKITISLLILSLAS